MSSMQRLNVIKVCIINSYTGKQKWGGVVVYDEQRPPMEVIETTVYKRAKVKKSFLYELHLTFCKLTTEEILNVVLRNIEIERGVNYES